MVLTEQLMAYSCITIKFLVNTNSPLYASCWPTDLTLTANSDGPPGEEIGLRTRSSTGTGFETDLGGGTQQGAETEMEGREQQRVETDLGGGAQLGVGLASSSSSTWTEVAPVSTPRSNVRPDSKETVV